MRIKNFLKFVNENLEPHSAGDKSIQVDVRQGEPILYDGDEFSEEEWNLTGDLPRKQKPDTDYTNQEEGEEEDLYDDEDDIDLKGYDNEPFISDTDDDTEESDQDYIY